MSKTIGITGHGFKNFDIAIDRFERKVIKDVKRIVAETAEMIVSQAKALAPVDEGHLKNSINVHYYNRGLSAEIIVGAEYAIYVEYGTGIYAKDGNGRKTPWVYYSDKLGRYVYTRGIHAQPYWNPSVERARAFFKTEMNKIG